MRNTDFARTVHAPCPGSSISTSVSVRSGSLWAPPMNRPFSDRFST